MKKYCTVCLSLLTMILLAGYRAFGEWETAPGYARAFIENKGQYNGRDKQAGYAVLFAADQGPHQVYFSKTGITYRLDKKLPRKKWDKKIPLSSEADYRQKLNDRKEIRMESELIYMNWENCNSHVELMADDILPDYFSYGMGSNNINYNHVKGYRQLTYKNLYPGIDLVYQFHPDKGLKYHFIVQPGADTRLIKLNYKTESRLELDESGNILIKTFLGNITDHAPLTFYENNQSKIITSSYSLSNNTVSFNIGSYDRSQSIVIDPWTVFPASPNSNKVWEVETDLNGNVYTYSGDMPVTLRKYNNLGSLQWTYLTSWDSSGYWIGGMKAHPNGDVYMTSGSNGEIRKILPSGSQQWFNNPNLLTSYEYWSLAFNCDYTKLVVGGTRLTFSIPFPIIRGTVMNINLTNGALLSTTEVGYGSVIGIPPDVQEVSSICSAPNGNYYFLTLDSVGSVKDDLSTIPFKTGTTYNFDYYIPGYGFGTKQPISAIRATASEFYTHNGVTIDRRDLFTGAITGTAAIPGGITSATIFGTNVQGNGGLDIDSCGFVYVGSGNAVHKFDPALNLVGSVSTPGPVYDVSVTSYGDIAASGNNFISSLTFSACNIPVSICITTLIASASATDATCAGTCDGTASASQVGGTPPISYSWSNGSSSQNITGLCAGVYTVIVTDANLLSDTATVTVSEPAPISVTISITDASCGASNGTATVTPSGGVGSYTYLWSPQGGTDSTAAGLAAGNYTVAVTDSNGCSMDTTITINTVSGPQIVIDSQNDAFCYGSSSGSATVQVVSGVPPYTYIWNTIPNQTTPQAVNLGEGTYMVFVTDSNGCTSSLTVTINEPDSIQLSAALITNDLCGQGTGSASASASGGTPGYSYLWSTIPQQTGASISNLASGTYTVTVTDANFCTSVSSVTIGEIPAPVISPDNQTNVTCAGLSDGSASVSVSSGTAPFTYIWSTIPVQTTPVAANLAAGSYTVVVSDSNACTDTLVVVITEPDMLSLAGSSLSASCGLANGSALVNVSGGTPGYSYTWSSFPGQNMSTLVNIPAGTYTVTVTDASGCTSSTSVTVGDSPSLNATASTSPACGAGNGTATATASGGVAPYTYSWSPAGGNQATATGLNNGNYTCVITDVNGCAAIVTVNVTVYPGVNANAGPDVIIQPGSSVQLSASGGISWNWNPAEGLSCNDCQNPVASPGTSTTYCVTITDSDGCTGSDCLRVELDTECGEVYVPDAFSPDGSDHPENEKQCVYGRCIQTMEFSIFTRWGEKVFETTSQLKCWDGTYKGKAMNTGVYVYFLKATLKDGSRIMRKGDINLIR